MVHDLDVHNESELRNRLEASIAPSRARASVVLIPKREIEAWLLYDEKAIASAFREQKAPVLPGNPESLQDPKKYLRDLVWKSYRKSYLNTLHNPIIAKHISVGLLKRCNSFSPHFDFILKVKDMIK